MAAYSMFCFHILLMILVLAAAHSYHDECPESQPCGYLGYISYPFTAIHNEECGTMKIRGCENEHAVKQIQLTDNLWYNVVSIVNLHPSVFIHCPDSDTSQLHILNNITFFRSNRSSPDHCDTPIPPNMSLYISCPHYNISFTSSHAPNDSLHMPTLPYPCLLFQRLPYDSSSFTFLFSVLEIKIDLPPSPPKGRNLKATIGLSVGIASLVALVLLLVVLFLYKGKNKYLGLQNISTKRGYSASFTNTTVPGSSTVYFGIPVFSYEKLQKATNDFNQARELGEGGFGTVYYGTLEDGREVAVKRLFERNYRPVESFINEIKILTRLRHTNLVSLYGCTSRHSRELLLVYEYVPNGTLSSHLHADQTKPCSLPWPVRMKIAIETASALAYLHAKDIIHRDVKTSNILLDNDFGVKVADFGLSRLFPDDVTHISTAPRGTPGYVDPDYRLCYQLTTKSDVYSFGVVLAELISSLKPVDMDRSMDDVKLSNLAIRKIQKGAISELVDPFLGFQSDEKLKRMILSVAELAFLCLQGDKDLRPSMSEVFEELQRVQSGCDEPGNLEGIVLHGATTTTRASQSYAHPPLPNSLMRPQQRLHQIH
ncbi:hypothetical protein VNO78_09472 [Psophocarpus tetragonolobus]|uniref:Protein kinase domain-containing protein n=1 Tax=Psophocarpus tetragonolobus TaxID=3891 RepID=A0AAN9SZA4_PSOTE